MAYPSFAQHVGSDVRYLSDRVVTRDTGGGARASSFYDAVKRQFTIRHRLSAADLATLEAHWEANQTASFDFTWAGDSQTYTVIYGARGLQVSPGAVHHDVAVELEEV